MASIRKEIHTSASPGQAWDAFRDIRALHTRLLPGFVVDAQQEPSERIVTFGNRMERLRTSIVFEGIVLTVEPGRHHHPGDGANADCGQESDDDVIPLLEGGCGAFRRNVDRTLESTGEVSQ